MYHKSTSFSLLLLLIIIIFTTEHAHGAPTVYFSPLYSTVDGSQYQFIFQNSTTVQIEQTGYFYYGIIIDTFGSDISNFHDIQFTLSVNGGSQYIMGKPGDFTATNTIIAVGSTWTPTSNSIVVAVTFTEAKSWSIDPTSTGSYSFSYLVQSDATSTTAPTINPTVKPTPTPTQEPIMKQITNVTISYGYDDTSCTSGKPFLTLAYIPGVCTYEMGDGPYGIVTQLSTTQVQRCLYSDAACSQLVEACEFRTDLQCYQKAAGLNIQLTQFTYAPSSPTSAPTTKHSSSSSLASVPASPSRWVPSCLLFIVLVATICI